MFKELTDKLKYSELEQDTLKFWKERQIFEKSLTTREGKPGFTFYEGPPTANGRPGIHHVMARTLKDLVCRYKTLRGFQVHRKGGWDTHGLPVEIEVEKQLGITHKSGILDYGVDRFNNACRASVFQYLDEWKQMTERIGYWIDLNHAYITCSNEYIESVWWALKSYFDAGLIYKGHKIQPYCPRCETVLSSHEVSLGYMDVKDPSVYVKMKVKGEENTYFLVWTTTPWTLISNVALAVHPDIEYVKVFNKGEYLILAKERLSVLEGEYQIVEESQGTSLAGKVYDRIFSYVPVKGRAFYVVEGDFVTTEDGSGIVHMAPAFGEDDYQVGRQYGLPTLQPVDQSGAFTEAVTDFRNKFVKDADPDIIYNLRTRNILYKKETITHSYPHCWRCKSPLLYYARETWYIRTTGYAENMIEKNKEINWIPAEVSTGRFGNWLAENKDWALSRDRFWGTPLPIWVCEKCGEKECIGSVEDLKSRSKEKIESEKLDLHKPYVDEICFDCTKCGGPMKRVPEVIDCWFDSGSMPFAQFHYPFENKHRFESNYPSDFIAEGIDQTRGWFYTLHAIGTFLFDKPAYKNVIAHELILDKEGKKMSKSLSNTVDPFEVVRKFGADTTRWYLITTSPPWRPTLWNEDGLAEVQRKFLGTLINTYAFFALYANIDKFVYSEERIPVSERPEIDRWIISILNSLVKQYAQDMDSYDVTKASRSVSDFAIDQLSNWYVRRNRRRFWKSESGKDKLSAYQTLYECLVTMTKLMAPFVPFLAEELYRNLNTVTGREPYESVHLVFYPEVDETAVDKELESRMNRAQRVVYLTRSMRAKSNLKVRQPLKRILIPLSDEDRRAVHQMESIILEEINVKEIEYVKDDAEIVSKRAKPNFKSIGPKFGKDVNQVANSIRALTKAEIKEIETRGEITVAVKEKSLTISRSDIGIFSENIEGWLVESDGVLTVALDTELTEELITEGLAREFVNRVQNLRKDQGFRVTDRIKIFYSSSDKLDRALRRMAEYIETETLAMFLINELEKAPQSEELDINGEQCRLRIEIVD
jgi:isoleucyl-tRNA synthetase